MKELTERDKVQIRLLDQVDYHSLGKEEQKSILMQLLSYGCPLIYLQEKWGVTDKSLRFLIRKLNVKKKMRPTLHRYEWDRVLTQVPEVVRFQRPSVKAVANPFSHENRDGKKRLTATEVMYIVKLLESGHTYSAIRAITGCSTESIQRIRSGKNKYYPRRVHVHKKVKVKNVAEVKAIPLTKAQWESIVSTVVEAFLAGKEHTLLVFPKGTCPPNWFCKKVRALSSFDRTSDCVRKGGTAAYKTKSLLTKFEEVGIVKFSVSYLEEAKKKLDKIEKMLYN